MAPEILGCELTVTSHCSRVLRPLDGWMDGWMDGRMDGWMDVDGWMDGWMDGGQDR